MKDRAAANQSVQTEHCQRVEQEDWPQERIRRAAGQILEYRKTANLSHEAYEEIMAEHRAETGRD